MRHLMRYEGFSSQERLDEILDKISDYGIVAISTEEKEFLDAHKEFKEDEVHRRLQFKESEIIFEDDNHFRFEFKELIEENNEIKIIGILYVPDLEINNGNSIKGRLEGEITFFENNETSVNFYKNFKERNREIVFDVFDFIEGLEYEFDSFIDYIVNEVKNTEF